MSDGNGEEPRDAGEPVEATDAGLRRLLEKLSTSHNFDFREYKAPSLARRIRTRLSQARVESFDAYAHYLDEHPLEYTALFNAILINVTGFFRDPEAWNVIAADVLPRVVEASGDSPSIRIWSAGCSSGEESYSVAMLLAEHLGDRAAEYLVKIYATDIDEEALSAARRAVYRLEQLKDVPDNLIDRYFVKEGQLYRVRRDLRRWCIFGAHNLGQAPPLSHVDLLLCRNVLIYFTSELQERVLSRFHYAIRENGFLFLGRSESLLTRSRLFRPVHLKWRIFERTAAVARQATAVLPEREEAPAPATTGAAGAASPRAEAPPIGRSERALEALPAAVLVIDAADSVITFNAAAEALFDVPAGNAVARKFRDLDVSYRVEGLRARIEEVKVRHAPVRMENAIFSRRNGDPVHADIWIQPLFDGYRLFGILVFAIEATEHALLKEQIGRVAEQHATAIEELQSTNEELETTNEELQSTNEELETTNEELQSTNEELETTVEELQAANTELGTLNAELEGRTAELHRLDAVHRSLMNSLESAVVVLDRDGLVTSWNQAAERSWGLKTEQAVGRQFFALPIGAVSERVRGAFDTTLTGEPVDVADVASTLAAGAARRGVLHLQPLRNGAGDVVGVIALMSSKPGPASKT
jgi:two-component system, chemotaxis family, CheB/CheR fusion protein